MPLSHYQIGIATDTRNVTCHTSGHAVRLAIDAACGANTIVEQRILQDYTQLDAAALTAIKGTRCVTGDDARTVLAAC